MATRSSRDIPDGPVDADGMVLVRRRRKAYRRWQRHGPGLCLRKRIEVKATIVRIRVKAPVNYEFDLR